MKHILAMAMAVVALCLAAPALAQLEYGQDQMDMPDLTDHNRTLPPEPQARADGLRLQGRCEVAIPIYRALMTQGAGFELAEFNLGLCQLAVAKKETDAAAAAALRSEAAAHALRAANSGLPNAQNGMVSFYLDGTGVTADPVEAGKWSLLYHGSQVRRMYRLPDVAPALQARLDAVLNANGWAQAQKRADAWMPVSSSRNGR